MRARGKVRAEAITIQLGAAKARSERVPDTERHYLRVKFCPGTKKTLRIITIKLGAILWVSTRLLIENHMGHYH